MKLSELIIDYRKKMNISQREFSRKCDLSNTYISFIENEKNPKTGRPLVPNLELGVSSSEPFPDDLPKNDDIRLLIRGLNKLSPDQVRQAKNVMKAMFAQYADYFDSEKEIDQ